MTESWMPWKIWLAMDVIPSLRRTGSYEVPKKDKQKKEKLPYVIAQNLRPVNPGITLYCKGFHQKLQGGNCNAEFNDF